jgi:hypothetical protein
LSILIDFIINILVFSKVYYLLFFDSIILFTSSIVLPVFLAIVS